MKKCILVIASVLLCVPALNAQITEGQPSSKTIRTGNRPKAGSWGLYLGATSDIVYNLASLVDGEGTIVPLPLINFKYMPTNKMELRIGLDSFSEGSNKAGEINSGEEGVDPVKFRNHDYNVDVMLYPGVAYHFNSKNILDVYVGAELPLGFESQTSRQVYDDTWARQAATQFKIGIGAFVGLQVFVANLPFAIGLEYGLSANGHIGGQNKITTYDGVDTQVKYTDSEGTAFDKLRMSKGIFGQQVRFTLSYYFK